jgi:hypothetical protein
LNYEKSKALKFYLSNIKPYSDKIPYFRKVAKNIWNIVWKFKLKLKSIWLSIDFEKIYWLNPKKILYGLEKDDLMVSEYKYKEKKIFKCGDLKRNLIKYEDKIVYRSLYSHFIEGKEWEQTDLYKSNIDRINKGKYSWYCHSVSEYNRRCEKLDKLYNDITENGIRPQTSLSRNSLLKENMIKEIENEIVLYIGS